MELTKGQRDNLITFIDNNEGVENLADYSIILDFIRDRTMSETAFDLNGEQTDDINEVYAYMMRNGLTSLDLLKKSDKKAKQ